MYQISIEQNLARILSTTKGAMPLNYDFGLSPEYIDRTLTNEAQIALKDEILEQIALYEPRISPKDIKLEVIDSALTLHINAENENFEVKIS